MRETQRGREGGKDSAGKGGGGGAESKMGKAGDVKPGGGRESGGASIRVGPADPEPARAWDIGCDTKEQQRLEIASRGSPAARRRGRVMRCG